jgi:hypothetical protein
MSRIESNSRRRVSSELLHRNFPARSDVAIVFDAPGANRVGDSSIAAGNNQALGCINLEGADATHAALRSADHSFRLDVPVGGAIEDQHRAAAVYGQNVMDRIHGHCGLAANLRVGPGENPLGRYISIRGSIEYEHLAGVDRDVDFVIRWIYAHLIVAPASCALDLRVGTLNHAKGRFLPVGSAAETQNCLCQRAGDADLVVNRIKTETVHRPADQCLLTFQRSDWWCIFPRQPGEGRNLRMVHSIRHQDLLPHGVVHQGLGLAESQRDLVLFRAANNTQGSYISSRVERIHSRRRITQVSNP